MSNTSELINTECEYEFQFEENGRWFSTTLSVGAAQNLLNTGLLDSRNIAAFKVVNVNADAGRAEFVYDFVFLKKGLHPWRVIYTAAPKELEQQT